MFLEIGQKLRDGNGTVWELKGYVEGDVLRVEDQKGNEDYIDMEDLGFYELY